MFKPQNSTIPLFRYTNSMKSQIHFEIVPWKIGPFLIALTIIFTIAPLYYPSIVYYFNNGGTFFGSPNTTVEAFSILLPKKAEGSISHSEVASSPLQLAMHEKPKKSMENLENEKHGHRNVTLLPKITEGSNSSDLKKCDLFVGEWVWNPSGPYYTNRTCWAIQEHQNCMKYGRPDDDFMKWRWKPNGCELAAFDPVEFLNLMKGKSIAFVGDSVARNHMQSLICLLSKVAYPNDISDTKDENFKRFEYTTYNFTISIFWSPYLVKTKRTDPNDVTRPFNLYLDEPDPSWITQIESFNYIIISAGHWFARPTTFYLKNRVVGCLYCPQTNITHMTNTFSYKMAFRTTFKAINKLKNYKGLTLLRTFAPSHFENGVWDKGGDCTRTKPFKIGEIVVPDYVLEMHRIQVKEFKVAEKLGKRRGVKFKLMDLTGAMLLRGDGHPSKYGHWSNENITTNDCVHWCLPGPIDTWNDFLIEIIKREEGY